MSASPVPVEQLSYEQAFAELESIVASLETEQKSLEEAIALFERGQLLAKHCQTLLENAEIRIRQLSKPEEEENTEG
ncbi:MAG: exodeoxyribonuclease VII small subunit [Anaerolineales bacterium]|jgi:exodeoxyribonuclease VII small subunit